MACLREQLARQPFGRIPAFAHDGFVLYETAAITRYIDEAFAGPRLQPQELRARARMNQVIAIVDSYAYRPMIWGVFAARIVAPEEGVAPNEMLVAESLAQCPHVLSRARGDLSATKRYFAGDELTLADLHALPIMLYFAMTHEGRETLSAHPRLRAWLDATGRASERAADPGQVRARC